VRIAGLFSAWLLAVALPAQQSPPPPQPQVKLNVLNVCAPSEADKKEIASVMAMVPHRPAFAPDFEIARGRTVAPDLPLSEWVRVRHELSSESPIANATYSFSVDPKGMGETLVLRAREGKDFLNISFEDAITGVESPTAAMQADTPVTRINIERLGKGSLALARCPNSNQSAYESLFGTASALMADYRRILSVRRTVPGELSRLSSGAATSSTKSPAKKSESAPKK